MGATIEAVASARSANGPFATGALGLADEAARDCLASAGRRAEELDILVNAGLYRDKHLGEPALAALIQEDIGANLGPTAEMRHGTFSFDIANGSCGVLTGFHLVTGLLRGRTVNLGMVVASDADPEPARSQGFPFKRTGAAALLRWQEGEAGFTHFHFDTFPQYEDLFQATLSWHQEDGHFPHLHAGHNVLVVDESVEYLARSVECAELAARKFLMAAMVRPAEVDLVIPSHSSQEFPGEIAQRLNIASDKVVRADKRLRGAHTAGTIVALDAAIGSGRLAAARTVLFVSAGAGISVALALYRTR